MEERKTIEGHLKVFNNNIIYLNVLNNDLAALFSPEYDIKKELKIIENFLEDYFFLAKNRIILLLCAMFEDHITGYKGKNRQLSFNYFVQDTESELYKELIELKVDRRFIKINKYRDKVIGHFDLKSVERGSQFFKELNLTNKDIYEFTKDTVDFAKKLSNSLGILYEDFEVINPSSEDVIFLAENYKVAKEIKITTLKRMKNQHLESYNKIKFSIKTLIADAGY